MRIDQHDAGHARVLQRGREGVVRAGTDPEQDCRRIAETRGLPIQGRADVGNGAFTEGQALCQRAAVADARQVQPQRREPGRRQRPGEAHVQAMRSDPMDHARVQQRDGWPLLPRDFAFRFGEDGDDATCITG